MLRIEVLSYLLKNPKAKAWEIAWALGQEKKSINRILYDFRDSNLARLNATDFTWRISEKGSRYLSEHEGTALDKSPPSSPAPLASEQPQEPLKTDKMTTTPSQNPELSPNLARMFGFLEEWYKMDLTALRDIRTDSRIRWSELTNQAIAGLPGILVGDEIADKSCWLSIERLKPNAPPALTEVLEAWGTVEDDPGIPPEIAAEITFVDEEETEALWEQFRESKRKLAALPDDDPQKDQELEEPEDVIVRHKLEDHPEIQAAWDEYMIGWQSWAPEEAIRRKTINLYKALFSFRQQLENGTAQSPQEMVWGVGMTYRSGEERLRFPLISIPVEFVGSSSSLTLKIAGLDRPPQCNIHAFLDEFPEGAADFEKFIREELSPGPEKEGLSPFDSDRIRKLLTVDAGRIDSSTSFAETRPDRAETVTFTLDWAVMIQTRSTNYMLQDVQRLKEIAEEGEVLTSALDDIAIRREDPYPESQNVFRGFSHIESDPDLTGPTCPLYFPKPYNQEQVEVIRKLENSEGVVLQGPPGTGKTHTIANVISHYLATGKRVLVTSQKTPALKVLKSQLPEGIQMLTGLLLDSDREGQAELESSVNKITSDILQLNPASLKKEAQSLATVIETSHEQLQINEKKTDALARHYRTSPPEHIGCDSPRQLAEEVAESADLYGDFPAELDPKNGWKENGIDHNFFERLRVARKTVGDYLQADHEAILAPEELPSVEDCADLHKNLCSYSATRGALDALIQHPAKKYLKAEQRPIASDVLTELEWQQNALEHAHKGDWQRLVFWCYHSPSELPDDLTGIDHRLRESINDCIETCRQNDLEVKQYALKPVLIPDGELDLETLLVPVTKASDGDKPFTLVDRITSKNLRNAFHSITIRGAAPSSVEEWEDIKRWIELHLEANKLARDWNIVADSISAPGVPLDAGTSLYSKMRPIVKQVEGIWRFKKRELRQQLEMIAELLDLEDQNELLRKCFSDPKTLPSIVKSLRLLVGEFDGREASTQKQMLLNRLDGNMHYTAHSSFLKTSLGSSDIEHDHLSEEWRTLIKQAINLHSKIPTLKEIASLVSRLQEAGARNLAKSVSTVPYNPKTDDVDLIPQNIGEAWKWAMRRAYLRVIDSKSELFKLNIERLSMEKKLSNDYEQLAVKRTWLKLQKTFKAKPSLVTALNQFVGHIKRIGKGTGKLAPFHRAEAQKALSQANEAIRCWIMPQWRISERLPAGYGLFDLVIIDEASQSDLKALPAMARGKKVLIVGDDKQVSPLQVGTTNQSVIALYQRFLKDLPYGSSMTIKDSVYDLASIAYGAASIRLREHFRCAEPIINYSSQNFYDGEIRCLRVPKATERMQPVLIDVHLEGGVRSQGTKTNNAEAEYIVEEINRLTNEDSFGERTIGIVTLLGNEQSRFIWDKIQASLSEEAIMKHQIRCGDSSTFQGSEFDVVFLSMVDHVSKRAVTTIPMEQRYNVAASRAKDRMYLCRSIPLEGLKSNDLRYKLISHFSDPGLKLAGKGREDCESPFESEIFDFLCTQGYMVSTQVAAAGFRIDLVVEDAAGRRLAIECDGYIAHPEHKWAEDMSRQRTLERAGWSFHRIWGPSYYSDKNGSKKELLAAVSEHGIEKHHDGMASAAGIVEYRHFKIENELEEFEYDGEEFTELSEDTPQHPVSEPRRGFGPLTSDKVSPRDLDQGSFKTIDRQGTLFEEKPKKGEDEIEEKIQVGDSVTVQFDDDDDILSFTIVREQSSEDGSLLNYKAPIVEVLLNQSLKPEIAPNFEFRGRPFRVIKHEKND